MKKILFKIFPILEETIPQEYMNEDHIVYKFVKFMFYIGFIIGSIFTMIIIKVIESI